ncbi:hypothetical protein MSAN_01695000 [Mycena sanguinolenta]|uniref:Uncharacterized protein n=1 Tax=Mycena sanguinolenta TaxID=230812 RepID=A0A8H6Y0F0_9AGAR|nr:hypothetical protein MSAN_01695000 [Mycena sanguinolenta]
MSSFSAATPRPRPPLNLRTTMRYHPHASAKSPLPVLSLRDRFFCLPPPAPRTCAPRSLHHKSPGSSTAVSHFPLRAHLRCKLEPRLRSMHARRLMSEPAGDAREVDCDGDRGDG